MSAPDHRRSGGSPGKLRLDKPNGRFLGVCSGLANYLNIDPLIVRLAFVAGTLFGFGTFILIYFAIALLAD
ncbi:recombinase RecF [Altererythrobacter sp. B11]|uniref:PspC domain-containing protein n=1 Tax=Altererythrobacter sp. B11 TaxID=2060312 RepID=UPI000DC70B34|nr:PspC domain-containing protein [Altererythrobacter sp. B11]BBC74079.1 recombinase RecF [Altererythrobacter sp. B11]